MTKRVQSDDITQACSGIHMPARKKPGIKPYDMTAMTDAAIAGIKSGKYKSKNNAATIISDGDEAIKRRITRRIKAD